MRTIHFVIFGLTVLNPVLNPSFAAQERCDFRLDPASVKVNWTAFKTTEKLAVSGTVKEVAVQSVQKAKSLKELIEKTTGKGKFDAESKSDSGNPARDTTVYQKFFSLLLNQGEFKGSFVKLSGSNTEGKVGLQLSVNGKKALIPMDYKLSPEGHFEASGSFDMMNMGMQKAHESIHTACEKLHQGKDGISKTWTEVGVKVSAMIQKDCHS